MTKFIGYLIIAIALFVQAGCSPDSGSATACYSDKLTDKGKVLTKMSNDPHFKGGHDSLVNFLSANINHEKLIPDLSQNGKIFNDTARIKFIVSKQGSLSDLSVTLAKKKIFADEIAKAIKKSSCNWVAGTTEQQVNGWFQFDIYFLVEKLNNEIKTTMTVNEFGATDEVTVHQDER